MVLYAKQSTIVFTDHLQGRVYQKDACFPVCRSTPDFSTLFRSRTMGVFVQNALVFLSSWIGFIYAGNRRCSPINSVHCSKKKIKIDQQIRPDGNCKVKRVRPRGFPAALKLHFYGDRHVGFEKTGKNMVWLFNLAMVGRILPAWSIILLKTLIILTLSPLPSIINVSRNHSRCNNLAIILKKWDAFRHGPYISLPEHFDNMDPPKPFIALTVKNTSSRPSSSRLISRSTCLGLMRFNFHFHCSWAWDCGKNMTT